MRDRLDGPLCPAVVYCHDPWEHAPFDNPCWINAYRDRFERLSPRMVTFAKHMLRTASMPSTGLMALALALHLCGNVSVFGFGRNRSLPCAKYYGPCVALSEYDSSPYHDLGQEHVWLRRHTAHQGNTGGHGILRVVLSE